MINIPKYRAKKIDSDEYVEGDLIKRLSFRYIAIQDTISSNNAYDMLTFVEEGNIFEIDQSTLSIHFPNMIDSNNKPIFASLSEEGKGGDRLIEDGRLDDGFNVIYEPYYRKDSFSIEDLPVSLDTNIRLFNYKIIGIQS